MTNLHHVSKIEDSSKKDRSLVNQDGSNEMTGKKGQDPPPLGLTSPPPGPPSRSTTMEMAPKRTRTASPCFRLTVDLILVFALFCFLIVCHLVCLFFLFHGGNIRKLSARESLGHSRTRHLSRPVLISVREGLQFFQHTVGRISLAWARVQPWHVRSRRQHPSPRVRGFIGNILESQRGYF